MDDVGELLKTWELPNLIPAFTEQQMTVQALAALTQEDVKDLIPLTGPRVLFTRCWRTWKKEFLPTDNNSISSLSGFDLSNLQFDIEPQNTSSTIITLKDCVPETQIGTDNTPVIINQNDNETSILNQFSPILISQSGLLENLLKKSLETSSLLIYKGGALDGDATRNLLASVIAKEILNEYRNSPIVGPIYFKWTKLITELFPGERTTTYYIPACTTASGVVLQARGKLVHQVLNKRRRFQQLGSLETKKRNREESPGPSFSSPRPLPDNINAIDIPKENEREALLWLKHSTQPWDLVEKKWKATVKQRIYELHNQDKQHTIESYINLYPALRTPQGYTLLTIDFEEIYKDHSNNLFAHFPIAKIKIAELLKKRNSKDAFCQELIFLSESTEEEHKNLGALLAIPHLLNTSTIKSKKKKPKQESGCNWKPSKAEARDAFIKHVRSDAEIGQAIELRLKSLKDKGVTPQPYVLIVGESLREIKTFFVIVTSTVIYQTANILQAIDTCYKAIWSLNLEYGCDSYAVWYFLQRGLYKMTSKFDRGSTTAESLLTDCNFLTPSK